MKRALLLCLIAAVGYGFGAVFQARGARMASNQGRSGVLKTTTQPLFLVGIFLDICSWVISRFALHTLPLFAVQTILAGSLAITVVLARIMLGTELRRSDRTAVGLTMIGLVLVGISAGEDTAKGLSQSLRLGVLLGVPTIAVAGLALIRLGRSIPLALLAGASFTGSAMAARTVSFKYIKVHGILTTPLVWAVVLYAAMALGLHAVALMKGSVGPVTAAMWATEVLVATIVGAALLDDHMRPGWQIPAIVGIALTVIATVILARSPAQELEQRLPARPVRTGAET